MSVFTDGKRVSMHNKDDGVGGFDWGATIWGDPNVTPFKDAFKAVWQRTLGVIARGDEGEARTRAAAKQIKQRDRRVARATRRGRSLRA